MNVPQRQTPERSEWVEAVRSVLEGEARWIAKVPGDIPSILYNGLMTQGQEESVVRELLQIPDGEPVLRVLLPRERPLRVPGRHRGSVVGCAAFDWDGPCVLSWSLDGTLKLWDIRARALRAVFTGHHGESTGCVVSPRAGLAVSASRDGTLRVWNLRTGELERALLGHQGEVLWVTELSSSAVTSGSADRTVRIWNLKDGTATVREHREAVTALSSDGHLGYADGTVDQFPARHGAAVTAVERFRYFLISASLDGTIRLWPLRQFTASNRSYVDLDLKPAETAEQVRTLRGHSLGVLGLAVHGTTLASWSYDRTICLWSLPDPYFGPQSWAALKATLQGHQGAVLSAAFFDEGRKLVSGSADGTVRLWDVEEAREIACLQGHRGPVRSVNVFRPRPDEGERVVTASDDRTLRIWSADDGSEQEVLDGDTHTLHCLATQNQVSVLTWTRMGDLLIHDVGDPVTLPSGLGSPPRSVDGAVLTSADRLLVLWSFDPIEGQTRFTVWNVAQRREIRTFGGYRSRVLVCIPVPDARLVVGYLDGTIEIWDLETFEHTSFFSNPAAPIADVAFTSSPEGEDLLCALWDGRLWVHKIEKPVSMPRPLQGHTDRVLACAIHPYGGTSVSASADRTLRLWFHHEGRSFATLAGHDDAVTGCAFTGDGSRVISRSQDGTLGIWDAQTGALLFRLRGHTDWVNAFALDEERSVLYSCSEDETIRAWNLATGEQRGVVYGVSPFRSLAVTSRGVCAGDESGNFWVLEYTQGGFRQPG